MTIPAQKPLDLMMDLRERMIRIETLLDVSVKERLEAEMTLATHALQINALQTEATVLKSSIRTFKWVGAAVVTVLTLLGDNLQRLFP